MTEERLSPDKDDAEVRGVRRIFLVALAAAMIAAGVALGVELSQLRQAAPAVTVSLLPRIFNEPGFSDGPLRRRQQVVVLAGRRQGHLHVTGPGGSVVYIVVRCDRGSVTARLDGLTSGAACSGRPTGVVRLTLARGGPHLQVSVDRAQQHDWAIGIYS